MKTLINALLLLIATVILPIVTEARMNETEYQMKSRYGTPVDSPAWALIPLLEGAVNHVYDYKGWTIRAAFIKERVVRIYYSKQAKPNSSTIIANDEAKAVLDAEVGNGEWAELGRLESKPLKSLPWAGSIQSWVHSNGNVACLCLSGLFLQIDSPMIDGYLAGRVAEKEMKRKASIPSF